MMTTADALAFAAACAALLACLWLAGCTPTIVRCVTAPDAEQQRWQRDVTEHLYDAEQRIERLEQWRTEQEGNI